MLVEYKKLVLRMASATPLKQMILQLEIYESTTWKESK